uniref:Pericentriolar material 1 n=1 Tax=Cyprinus carpio TaxID=7962 RepID=A0A8C2AA79_CYPCA
MMATGGTPFEDGTDEQELHNWSISNGSLDDRLNNMDWGVQQKKANRSSEKNRKKFSAMSESRLTNDISPESTPGAGRRRARTPHSFPHVKYSTQMSVPDQAELDRLRQVINFTDLDERSIGSDSQGRVTAANNQRQLSTEAKKPFNFLPIHLNTNKSKEPPASTSTPGGKEPKKQSPGKELFAPVPAVVKEPFSLDSAQRFGLEDEKAELCIDSSQGHGVCGEQKEELENMRKQHDLLKKMLEQQEQLRALQGRQAALLAMQQSAEQAIAVMDDTVVTETTGSVSGRSITSELNDELNDLIQRFHNQLHDSQSQTVPDNRRQAECLSLSREVCRSRTTHNSRSQLPSSAPLTTASTSSSTKIIKLHELQDKKQTMDKILQELHSLRDQTLNNSSCQSVSQRGTRMSMSERPYVLGREGNGPHPMRQDSSSSYTHIDQNHPADKLRKLKEVHKRLNELKELVQYYEQTSDMVVDTVNENVKEDDDETEDGSLFEAMFDSEQENHEPVTNIRNPAQPQTPSNWMDMNSLGKAHSASNNRDGRLNTECEINNRSAANLCSLNVPSVIECQFNRDRPYDGVKDEDEDEAQEDDDGARGGGGRDSDGSGYSHRSSLGGDTEYAQKVRRLQTAKQKLRQLQELVAMVQSDDTDGTTANEDEGLKQQPNNTRATAPKIQRDIALSEKTREKLYEEKLKQQQQELKQLHEERQRLMEIQGKIQDLQWACPDLQSSVSSSVSGQMRKIPAAASTPAPVPLRSSSSAKANTSGLKPTTEPPPVTVTDNELWSEMRRHQMLREELRQRRKHLESLMAEQQRRSTLNDSPFRSDTHETQSYSRDERTVATWGGSTQCPLGDEDDDDYSSEVGAEEDDDDEHDEGEESSSTDELHACSIQKQRNYSSNNRDGLKVHREINGSPSPRGSRGHPRQQPQTERGSSSRAKRQENLRWAADLSLSEGAAPAHWQEQITHLQKQLNFSTTMCQTLLQDQQTLSYMLQALLTGPYGVASNNVTSPQIPLIMHQLNQCYTQLAWQQNNVNRLKQVLNDLLQQQQSQSFSGQQQHQNFGHDSASSSLFVNYPPVNTLNMPGLPSFSSFPTGFNLSPVFPSSVGDFQQNQASSDQQHDPNISLKTEYMSFPPSLQRSPLNNAEKRFPSQPDNVPDANNSSWLNSSLNRSGQRTTLTSDHQSQIEQNSPSSSPVPHPSTSRDLSYIPDSQESVSSLPDRADPTTVTKTFRPGRKAAAQASLASRDKTPNTKSRRRRGRGQKNTASVDSDSASSDSHFDQDRERSSQVRYKDLNQGLLDKLTQEKLDSKTKNSKPNDLSSAYAWRTPFLSNRIACTEVPDVSSDFSLFEALRETIYSEVATLISQNESRPHFLIELFHELQLLNTDYLRQRALYSLQEIVTRHLTEKSVADEQASSLGPTAWATGSQSELTPSESLATSDNDTSEKIVTVKSNSVLKRVADRDSMDNESLLSTSSNLEPFASDDLGNTVIHLDKALARMRKYERMKLRAECNTDNPEHSPGAAAPTATSALTKGAGHSSTDAHCPQIDTQQLDRQIKAIMTEVIPFLKEHVGEVCSHQLLTSVRRMVLKLTRQNDESKEFVQFFHRQLGSILQDSLSKFVGRTLQDCGEDLLVEISEILFNELAFFRLMQDLDQNTSKIKHKTKRCSDRTSPKHSPHTEEAKTLEREKTFSPSYFDEDRDQDETEQGGTLHEREEDKEKDAQSSEASEVEDEEGEGLPLSISLSKAETQALCNYGSGEDENEVEEMEEFEAGAVEVQTSLQASMDNTSEHSQGSALRNEAPQETKSDLENSEGGQLNNIQSESKDMFQPPEEGREEAKTGSGDERREEEEDCTVSPVQETPQSSDTASPDTESPVMINTDEAGSGNTSQRSDEEDFVKVEDLPLQMSLLCEEELCKRISEEQQNNNLTAEILNGNKEEITGLVGNAQALKEPETIGAQSA